MYDICLNQFHRAQTHPNTPKTQGVSGTIGEVYINDYEPHNYPGYNNSNRSKDDIRKWAEKTRDLGKISRLIHAIETPLSVILKIASTQIGEDSIYGKVFFAIERFVDALGGYFRNNIYGHKTDEKPIQKFDDNLGAEEFSKDNFGDQTTYWISWLSHHFQTKARFLIPVIGLFSPNLANDIDWGVGGTLEGFRWKRPASNKAMYPGFLQDLSYCLYSKCKSLFSGEKTSEKEKLKSVWNMVTSEFKKHYNGVKESWRKHKEAKEENKEEEKNMHLNNFYKHCDQVTSTFLALSQWPNIIGDILRPIARRLDLSGTSRNLIRILSVIDRPFIWANYLFSFYLPGKINKNEELNNKDFFSSIPLFPIAMVGDLIHFVSIVFEDKVKESSVWFKGALDILGSVKNDALKIYFSDRRVRKAEEALTKLK